MLLKIVSKYIVFTKYGTTGSIFKILLLMQRYIIAIEQFEENRKNSS